MTNQLENQNNELLDFDWEQSENENFFNIGNEGKKVEEKVNDKEETKKDSEEDKETSDKESKSVKKIKEEEEEEEEDFFDSEENLKGSVEEKTNSSESSVYADIYKDLKEQGIFKHVDIEEVDDLDANKLYELQQEEYETEVSERLKAWATEELDDDAKAFIRFKREGGNTADFFEVYKATTDVPIGDIEDEEYQDEVIRYQLKEEGWDKDEIEDRLEYLTEAGKKERVAEKYSEKIKEGEEKKKKELIRKAEQQKLAAKEQEESFKNTLKETLNSTEEIKGFKISAQDKNKLLNFLTKKEYKVSDTRSITAFQKKLSEVFQDTDKMILLAKLVESDFDMSDFEKRVTTKKIKEVKTNLEQRKGLKSFNSGSSLKGSNLADLFN